jgi:hypothetical protein
VILWRGSLTNFTTSQTRFFIFTFRSRVFLRSFLRHRHGFGFLRSFLRHRHGFGFWRNGFRGCDRFLLRIYFRSFGDDDLRLLTGLGEDGELGGGALFATS